MILKKCVLGFLFANILVFSAWAAPKYETDVGVDETAKTVTEAKKRAISKAIRKGLNEIILNISTEQSVEEINKLNDNQLEHFITEVMVLMEKTSDVRYIADLRISVDGELLRAYLKENNLPIVISEEKEVVVVPLLENADGELDVWGDENAWRQAFLNRPNLHKANLSIHLIDKNLGNIAMIKPNRVFDLAEGEYKELIDFNRADILYILKYSMKDKKVYIKAYPSKEAQQTDVGDTNFNDVIDKVLPLLKDIKTKADVVKDYSVEQIDVIYNYPRLADWMSLKKFLEDNPQVQNIRLVSMANNKVHFNFQYSGVLEKLQGVLDLKGYKMKKEGEHYVIY